MQATAPLLLQGLRWQACYHDGPVLSWEVGMDAPKVGCGNPIGTPLEVVGGGLYPLFDLHVSSERGELLPKFCF